MGVNNVGAVAYYSEKKIYDLIGLTNFQAARSFAQGLGSIIEQIKNEQLSHLWYYESCFDRLYFKDIGLLGEKIKEFSFSGVSPFQLIVKPQILYRVSGQKNDGIFKDRNVLWELDVSNLLSESKKNYIYKLDLASPTASIIGMFGKQFRDGGRKVTQEEFLLLLYRKMNC